jgi:hypothetical protein
VGFTRRAALSGVAVAAVAVMVGTPALAADTGWRLVYSTHYGAASNYSGYTAVASTGPGNTWVFGSTDTAGLPAPGTPVATHWDGKKWTATTLPSGLSTEIDAASAVTSSDIWAVTEGGGVVIHWNGTAWSVAKRLPAPAGTDTLATDMLAFNAKNVWVFGNTGAGPGIGTWHYNGTTWTQPSGVAGAITGASAISSGDIWAAASSKQPGDTLLNYTGGVWKTVTSPVISGLIFSAVYAQAQKSVWATAATSWSSPMFLLHYDGGIWTKLKFPWTIQRASDFVSDGSGGFWLGVNDGTHNWLAHRTAAGVWSRTMLPAGQSLWAWALVPGTTSLFGAGDVATSTGENAAVFAYGPLR